MMASKKMLVTRLVYCAMLGAFLQAVLYYNHIGILDTPYSPEGSDNLDTEPHVDRYVDHEELARDEYDESIARVERVAPSHGVYNASHSVYNASATFSRNKCAGKEENLEDCLTLIVFTHNRVDTFLMVLVHYLTMPWIHKAVVLWSDKDQKPPLLEKGLNKFGVPIVVEHLFDDKIRSRYKELPAVETEAVLHADDDTLLSEEDVAKAFKLWQENKNRFIGFEARNHKRREDGTYLYLVKNCCRKSYSMVLSQINIYHIRLHTLFSQLPREIHEHIDAKQNCEDLAMNMLANDYCQCEAVTYVQPGDKSEVKSIFQSQLHGRRYHYLQRGYCIKKFTRYFKTFPLKHITNFF